jgi:NADH-quinone oxidoreductase subunit H
VETLTGAHFLWMTIFKVVLFFTLLMLMVGGLVLFERKVAGFIQDRSGPNRVGPWGLLQTMADGIKFLLKEETYPDAALTVFYLLAPMLAMVPATILFAVIPFASPLPTGWGLVHMIVADVPVGFLYVLAIGSFGVYGVVMAGWSSGSKYAFLGGMRGSAQMISYEVGLALTLVPIVLLGGGVRIPDLISLQQGFSGQGPATLGVWLFLPLGVSFFLFFITGLAETKRIPFDLPEAESELIAGYHTEYSAMKFGMFFLGEYAHMLTTAALITVFFLGGWDIPFWHGDNIRVLADGTVIGDPTWWKTVLTFLSFTIKTSLVVTVFVWIRWTLPRFRYDQLMELGWKFVIVAATAYVFVVAGSVLVLDRLGIPFGLLYAAILTGVNVVLLGLLVLVIDRGRLARGAAYTVMRRLERASRRSGAGSATVGRS